MDDTFGSETIVIGAVSSALEDDLLFLRDINRYNFIGLQFVWSNGASSPAGDIVLYGSNVGDITAIGNWIALTYSPAQSITGNSGAGAGINISEVGYRYIGVALNNIVGTYDLSIYLNGKDS